MKRLFPLVFLMLMAVSSVTGQNDDLRHSKPWPRPLANTSNYLYLHDQNRILPAEQIKNTEELYQQVHDAIYKVLSADINLSPAFKIYRIATLTEREFIYLHDWSHFSKEMKTDSLEVVLQNADTISGYAYHVWVHYTERKYESWEGFDYLDKFLVTKDMRVKLDRSYKSSIIRAWNIPNPHASSYGIEIRQEEKEKKKKKRKGKG